MEPVNLHLLWALILAALLNLDRQAVGQSMLARPLVTGLLVGHVLDNPLAGLYLGLWTELLWLTRPPLGGVLTPNGGLAVSAALLAWSAVTRFWHTPPERPVLVFICILIPPVAVLATGLEKLSRRVSGKVEARLEENLAVGGRVGFMWPNLKGLLFTLAAGLASLSLLAPILALFIIWNIKAEPAALWPFLDKLAPFMPLVGLTINIGRLRKSLILFYGLGLLAGIIITCLC
ncbi:MAG: PTS sugar transporter subunit IIC [Deltaproteobacteria bacterium]|jgi:PTS system mannose-specific IIC component|nr:PTS sugar transporter subunit IIC [Deltaproteobacteria bacterium]